MATCLKYNDLRYGYVDLCRHVVDHGWPTHPRGLLTHELTDVTIEVEDPTDVLPVGVGRKLNGAIAAAEALQLIAGRAHHELLPKISSNFKQFMDGDRFWGAYGDRIRVGSIHQAAYVVRRLKADPDSRQALIVLWRPELDLVQEGRHDYPCTTMLMFLIRGGKLQLHVTMRSNDVWWGLAYDAFQFTQLQLTVANALGIEAGSYFHHAISLHAYKRDFESIGMLQYPIGRPPSLPTGIKWEYTPDGPDWEDLELTARGLLVGNNDLGQHPWWLEQIGKYL